MKISTLLLAFTLLFMLGYPAISQDISMDFTQDDCGGISHQLFTEHDAGKVIILEFVMLNCAPCISATKALETLLQPYETNYPGRVQIYSFGFLNSYKCDQMSAWRSNNHFNHPVFSGGEEQVSYYGGMGMPTIVITGTDEHKVFYKSIGYTPGVDDEILAAIDSALKYSPSGIADHKLTGQFSIYPTVFSNNFSVKTDRELAGYQVCLTDSFGREIIHATVPSSGILMLDGSGLPAGIYFARLIGKGQVSEGIKLIKQN
jgi:thiol-disulfide isomerase/thioredoxin